MAYGGVPQNLSAKPTLSVITQSDSAVTVKLTLTYMASGFDWQANYVAQVKDPEGSEAAPALGKEKVDIFAWLTLANGGNQSFLNANTMAIAGEPNRERRGTQPRPTGGALNLKCWPVQRTHEVPYNLGYDPYLYPPPPPPPLYVAPMAAYMDADAEAVVVTGTRMKNAAMAPVAVVVAEQEDLGDLKLYRVPEPVTVNAKGQKQVAMIVKPGASFDRYYHEELDDYYEYDRGPGVSQPLDILMRSENRKEKGLGLPMPSGPVLVYEPSNYGPLLTESRASLKDRAVGDEVELYIGRATDVRYTVTALSQSSKRRKYRVIVTNARNEAVNVELEIPYQLVGKPKGITKVDGVPTWKATVPANGEAGFDYEIKLGREE
jgi:hypothetical protein